MNHLKSALLILTAAIYTASMVIILHPQRTSAWTSSNLSTCPSADLGWDWQDQIHTATTPSYGSLTVGTFAGGILMTQDAAGTNIMHVYFMEQGTNYKFLFFKNASVLGSPHVAPYGVYLASGGASATPVIDLDLTAHTATVAGTLTNGSTPTKQSALTCVRTAHDLGAPFVLYDASWDAQQFGSVVPAQSAGNQCNGALDVVCWVGKAFAGIADTFTEVGKAIVSAFASMFIPDSAKISDDFDSFNTFMTDKLGFLLYPFDFLGDMFSAFSDTSSSWCGSTCTKNFGSLFGHDFVVDFKQPATTEGDIWTWALAALRGLTVFELILAVWRKYKGVTAR